MATPAELADLHRKAQARLGALTITELAALWKILDINDLDGSTPAWLAASLGVVTTRREQSAALARQFLREYRLLALPGAEPAPPAPLPPIDSAAVATSLRVTGPIAIKASLMRGVPRSVADQTAMVTSARSGERHALSGGVGVVEATVNNDRRATGWKRDRSARACKFCSASENQSGSGAFRRHDGCHCQPVPAYS